MKKILKSLGVSATALLLVVAMLCNLVACSTPKPDSSKSETTSNTILNPPTEDTEPTIPGVVPTPEIPKIEVLPVYINLAQKQPLVGSNIEDKRTILADQLSGYKTEVSANVDDGLASYISDKIAVVYDTNADEYGVIDTVTVNDTILLEQGYYALGEKDLSLSSIYADYYEVEIDYTQDGKVEGLYYYDRYYIYHYDTDGKLLDIYRDGELYKVFTYNSNGNIVKEVSVTEKNSFENNYAYTEKGELYSVNNAQITKSPSIDRSSFEYNYTFNGENFLTSKTVNGVTTTYKYVGDKVVELINGRNIVSYILDKDLNYVGLAFNDDKYYFAVDPYGNVMGLVDCDGVFVVEYQYDIWGNILGISGALASSLGMLNEIVNLNGIYDHNLKCYFFAEDIYSPENGVTIKNGETVHARSMYEWEQSNYFSRSAVSTFALIHDMVVEVAVKNLKDKGVDVTSNLYATDKNGDSKRLVDIYTLPYEITPFATMNLLNGNQVYEVIYHAPESEKFQEIALSKLQKITNKWSISIFMDYMQTDGFEAYAEYLTLNEYASPSSTPSSGTMKFHGQFIYLDYLIDYKCNGNGIIEYQVKHNVKENYDQTINIYDYDNSKYVCYVNNTFDLEFLEGVTIIPSINQEQYEAIDEYLSEYLQSVAGNICDQMLIYDDPNYYDLENMNVMPDYWAQMNIEDTTMYLEIQADGSISVEKMPSWETDGFKTKLAIGAGVILVTAVVATVAIAIPGANCVVVSICVGAAKGAAAGAVSGFAMGFVTPVIDMAVEGILTGKWEGMSAEEYFDKALGAAADGFASGAITGAILGGISGGLNPKYCFVAGTPIATENGVVAIENIAIGDMVWSYDYKTGEKSLKPVTATTVRETNKIITLEIGGERIVTTPEHPFYVVNDDKYDGYVAAKYLSVGDCIQTADGGYLEITAIEQKTLDEPITVYNFTVDDNHSYYVGENELLAHNVSCESLNGRSNICKDWTRQDYLDNIDDIDLKETANKLYRQNAIIGDGGTADAVRYTKSTGKLVGNSDHIQKAQNEITHLQSLINRGLSYHDEQIALSLLRDLQHALNFIP